jgi:D-xylose transport system permease protein
MLSGLFRIILKNIRTFTMLFALGIIWLLFTILTGGTFFSPENLSNLFRQMTIISFIAIGMVLVIVTGNIDLSVGSVVGFISVVAAFFQVKILTDFLFNTFPDMDPGLIGLISTGITIVIALGVGFIIGVLQGSMIAYLGIPAFIVTLGGMMIYRGGVLIVTESKTIGPVDDTLKLISQGYLSDTIGVVLAIVVIILIFIGTLWSRRQKKQYGFTLKPIYLDLLKAGFFSVAIMAFVLYMNMADGVQYPVLLMAFVALIFSYLSSNTRFGRYAYAIGGNKEAARLSGINIKKNIFQVFILIGVLCAVAGVVLTARLGYGTTTGGVNYELSAIASCVIGGTSLMGGEGTILGALVGSLIMASLDNGMSVMNMGPEWQYVVRGLVLIGAVYVDVVSKKKK